MSTIAFTTYDNFLTAELEDLLEYAKPINAVNDSRTGNIVKVGEDVLGSAWLGSWGNGSDEAPSIENLDSSTGFMT